MKKTLLLALSILVACSIFAQDFPKREFRGVWMHTVHFDYSKMTKEELQKHWTDMLDIFESSGNNAIIFQIRPTADAFYISELEPWSRILTGEQGKAPYPLWDPLAFMIEETHKRAMEFHAWLNPYRVSYRNNDTDLLSENHLFFQRPDMFVFYGRQIYFDPGHPDSREHIYKVVADIVKRYDIDAIHMDDYFYPYPTRVSEFPDSASFAQFNRGFTPEQRDDWRRDNVNLLMRDLNDTIKSIKPWVKFGISPFGIWRNNDVDPRGSNTRGGVQNYDDLFADIRLWVENGWVDYNAPQLYWYIGHPRACYAALHEWWGDNGFGRHLYIGQSIWAQLTPPDDEPSQMHTKIRMGREHPNVHGNIWWSGDGMTRNPGGFLDSLRIHQRYPALVPVMKYIDSIPPAPIRDLRVRNTPNGQRLTWQATPACCEMDKAFFFGVYRFEENEPINIEDATKLQKVVRHPYFDIPPAESGKRYRYVVTAIDRLWNESTPSRPLRVRMR